MIPNEHPGEQMLRATIVAEMLHPVHVALEYMQTHAAK
jgi:hypothetical protein